MTAKKTKSSTRQPIRWPNREQWETTNGVGGVGAWASLRVADYVDPQEVAVALAALKPVRNRLNKQGSRTERQAIYWIIEALRDGRIPGSYDDLIDTISPVLYALPPAFLELMTHYQAAEAAADKIFQYATSDEMWEQEWRRRRHIEERVLARNRLKSEP
jgi:hypothetical protein